MIRETTSEADGNELETDLLLERLPKVGPTPVNVFKQIDIDTDQRRDGRLLEAAGGDHG